MLSSSARVAVQLSWGGSSPLAASAALQCARSCVLSICHKWTVCGRGLRFLLCGVSLDDGHVTDFSQLQILCAKLLCIPNARSGCCIWLCAQPVSCCSRASLADSGACEVSVLTLRFLPGQLRCFSVPQGQEVCRFGPCNAALGLACHSHAAGIVGASPDGPAVELCCVPC